MDKALACHAGGQGSTPDTTTEDLFCLVEIQICGPIPLGGVPPSCALSLLMADSYESSGLTCYREIKERVT